MSSQKLGGGLAPYLTNEAGHRSQVTLPQLDTAGRVRQPHRALSARETGSRSRQDRNNRADDEPRFNVGPRSFRSFGMNRGGRRAGRADRNTVEPFYEEAAYPDYPPPTFQEAMAETASISSADVMSDVASDVASVMPPAAPWPGSSSTAYDMQVQEQQQLQDPDISLSSSNASTILAPRESDAESISSLEIVEAEPVQERVPTPTQENHPCNCAERKVDFPSSAKVGGRGRQGARSRLNLTQDSDEDEPSSPPEPQNPTKRRNLSLSPLRTLFPFKNSEPHRAHSALPSANNSPYSHHTPFMSATSLPMKMSMSTTSFAHSLKAESLFGRKFLSFKGKERATFNTTDELTNDDWEVVDNEERPSFSSAALEMGATPISPPASPTQAQGSSSSPALAARKKPTPPPSPNKTDPLPPTPSSPEARPSPPPVENPPAATPQARSLNEPHPLSLRDKKVPIAPKRTHRQRHERRPPPLPEINMPLGPIITTVRTRTNATTTPPAQQTAASNTAGSGTTQAASPPPSPPPPPPPPPVPPPNYTPRAVNKTTPRVPRSPLHQSISVQPDPPMTPIFLTPPSTPVRATSDSQINRAPTPDNRNSTESHSPISTPYQTPRQGLSPNASTADLLEFTSGSSAASRRHYSGRPLPRPPGANQRIVDSVYASADDENPVPNCCPEGLLINLDEDDRPVASSPKRENILINLDDETPSPTSTTPTPSIILPSSPKTQPLAIPLVETPSTSSLEEIPGSPVDEEDPVTPPRSPRSPRRGSHTGPFLEVTDLDMLVNRLDEQTGLHNGSDYETLLTLTDFMGPASPNTVNRSRRASARITGRSRSSMVAGENVALAANVREVRRRITKDGRVKLKLVLLDISVDKCGICFSQFREADEARLGSLCKHAFHDKCLSPWLAMNQTCPMCRVALYDF